MSLGPGLLIRHHVDEIDVVNRLEIKVSHVPKAGGRRVRDDIFLWLLVVFRVKLLEELSEVDTIFGYTTTVIRSRVFLILISKHPQVGVVRYHSLTQSKSTPSNAYRRRNAIKFVINLVLLAFVLTILLNTFCRGPAQGSEGQLNDRKKRV